MKVADDTSKSYSECEWVNNLFSALNTYLWYRVLLQFVLVGPGSEESETFPGRHAAGPSCSLIGRGLGNGRDHQRFHACPRIVALLFAETGIDHVDDAVYR